MVVKFHFLFVLMGCFCIGSTPIHGQKISGVISADEDVDGDFQVSTGISIGLTGTKTFYNFSLVDENGFAYDTWSLLRNQKVVDHAGFSNAQIEAMGQIQKDAEKKLVADLPKGFSSDESKAEFEQIFLDAEIEMREVMAADQQLRFDQARNQLNLEQVGFAKFLSGPAMRESLGLGASDIESLNFSTENAKAKAKKIAENVLRELNLQLIDELSDKQSASFNICLNEKEKNEFLKQRLFSDNSPTRKIRKIPAPDFIRLLIRSKKTREAIEVTDAQLKDIKTFKERRDAEPDENEPQEIEKVIKKILTKEQYRKLAASTALREASRRGTVAALCGGSLGRCLDLSETDAERLFGVGRKINGDLSGRIQQAKLELWQETLSDISPEVKEKVISMMGKPIDLESE